MFYNLETSVLRGSLAPKDAPFDLLIEVPHGANTEQHYRAVESHLKSPLPPDLIAFYYVNTDVGAWSLANSIAHAVVRADHRRTVMTMRCVVPRTFIDANRVLDGRPEDYKAGKVTAAIPPWITHPDDHAILVEAHAAYTAAVDKAVGQLVDNGGQALFLHSYAPRTVDVQVTESIVADMRAAYKTPDRWPLRPEVDLIHRDPSGQRHVEEAVEEALCAELVAEGLSLASGETYPFHPVTQAWRHAQRLPGRSLCAEVRRDLVTWWLDPFRQVDVNYQRMERLSEAFGRFFHAWRGPAQR